ncbi:MAG: hypothetical protein ACP5XB_18940 [Isosphaeraceae bacterium]
MNDAILRSFNPSVLVVISHYNAWKTDQLVALLDQVASVPAGYPFQLRIVVNQAMPKPLELPDRHIGSEILYRENTGFNIGAWEHGWRTGPPYDIYLFLQEECRIAQGGWLSPFVRLLQGGKVGLVGELLGWNSTWRFLKDYTGPYCQSWITLDDGRRVDRATFYMEFLERRGIPCGPKGDHLQSLILCAPRSVLEAIDGFSIGGSYHEAVASEIAFSKKVQALGLQIKQIGTLPFTYIEHTQWSRAGRWQLSPLVRARRMARACLLSITPGFLKEQFDYFMMACGKCYMPPHNSASPEKRG